jgi:hypothetical protein
MKAELKSLDLNSAIAFAEFVPENLNHFGFWACASIGPVGKVGADLFHVFFCNVAWEENESKWSGVDRYIRLAAPYDPGQARAQLEHSISECAGTTWDELAAQLSKFSKWEFENYRDG